MADNKVVVNIYGEDYPITGVTDPKHISRVADLVDARMKESANASHVQARDKVAILTAMSIASELLEKNTEISMLEEEVDSKIGDLLIRLDKSLATTQAAS